MLTSLCTETVIDVFAVIYKMSLWKVALTTDSNVSFE
jgi:hypothetical protein